MPRKSSVSSGQVDTEGGKAPVAAPPSSMTEAERRTNASLDSVRAIVNDNRSRWTAFLKEETGPKGGELRRNYQPVQSLPRMIAGYIEQDQIAAIQDMIALNGKRIEIGGHVYEGYIEEGATSQEASEFGIDDFNSEYEVTLISDRAPKFKDAVAYLNRKGEVEDIEPLGGSAYALTISLYE